MGRLTGWLGWGCNGLFVVRLSLNICVPAQCLLSVVVAYSVRCSVSFSGVVFY